MGKRLRIEVAAVCLGLAAAGCGSGSGGGGTAAAPGGLPKSYYVTDLESASFESLLNGNSFQPVSISDSGLVSCVESIGGTTPGGAHSVSWFIVSSSTDAVTPYPTAVGFALLRDGLISGSVLIPATPTSPAVVSENTVNLAGATVPVTLASDETTSDVSASALSTSLAGTGNFTSGDSVRAVVWHLTPGSTTTAAQYVPKALSAAPGLSGSTATDINTRNFVVGASGLLSSNGLADHATLWDPSGVPTDLGLLPGAASSTAAAINDSNVAVGTSGDFAFSWTSAKGMAALPPLPGGISATGVGIADSGTIFGTSVSLNGASASVFTGVAWTDGIAIPLSSKVSGGWIINQVMAANKVGQIVAQATSSTGQITYVVLTPNT